MQGSFAVLDAPVECEQVIKKSRFMTYVFPVIDRRDALTKIQALRDRYPDARHHCWAFIAGAPDDTQVLGFSDDGEPSGTAGRPILAQLQGSGLGFVAAVVVRYFGGIKLGTGGLVRAYGGSVGQALESVQSSPYIAKIELTLTFDFGSLGSVNQLIKLYSGESVSTTYTEKVHLKVRIAQDVLEIFREKITDACRGQVQFIEHQ